MSSGTVSDNVGFHLKRNKTMRNKLLPHLIIFYYFKAFRCDCNLQGVLSKGDGPRGGGRNCSVWTVFRVPGVYSAVQGCRLDVAPTGFLWLAELAGSCRCIGLCPPYAPSTPAGYHPAGAQGHPPHPPTHLPDIFSCCLGTASWADASVP